MKFKAVVASAVGYNSGAVGLAMCFLPPELDDKLVDYIYDNLEYSFSELDGKHSKTDADIYIEYEYSALVDYKEETIDYLDEYIADILSGWDFVEEDNCTESIIEYNKLMREKISHKKVVTFYYDGTELKFN